MSINALVERTVLKVLGGFVMVTLLAAFSQPAFAISNMPSKGVCGFTISPQYPFATLLTSPGTGWGVSIIGTIDLSNKVIHTNVVLLNPSTTLATETQSSASDTYTGPVAGPFPGSHTITTTNYVINIVSVNNGNSLLLQLFNTVTNQQDGGFVGACHF